MGLLYRASLFISGAINLVPAVLAVFPEKISKSYGVKVLNPNYELLLRHRAVLFGIVGTIMISSAITRKNQFLATAVGLTSMLSYVLLAQQVSGKINPELTKVFNIDIAASLILVAGFIIG